MKKMMIAACAMAMAVAAQAANVTWGTNSATWDANATTRISAGLSVYLMSSADWSRSTLLADFADFGQGASAFASSTAWKSAAQISSTTTSANGKIQTAGGSSSLLPSETGSASAYYVIINGDKLFLSSDLSSDWTSVGDKYVFTYTTANSGNVAGSKLAATMAEDGLKAANDGAGWYMSVPEPTSGLMLLLGMGVLALRRRRA